jgi:two-component system nitrogen regulation sensor histidine kinase GlnL
LLGRKVEGADRAMTLLIADEVDRIAKLIDQMQTLSRRTAEPVAPCNLHEAIRRAAAILTAASETAPSQNLLRIEEEFDPSLPSVLGSAHGLVQVLINLLSNARDACRKTEGARIIVRTRFASGLQLHSAGQGSRCVCRSRCACPTMGRASIRPCATIFSSPLSAARKAGRGWVWRWCASWCAT